MYIFGIRYVPEDYLDEGAGERRAEIVRVPDKPFPEWEIIRRWTGGKEKFRHTLTETTSMYEPEFTDGVRYWFVTDKDMDAGMSFCTEDNAENIVTIHNVSKGGRIYQAERYLKKYRNWATMFAVMIKYGKLP